MLPDGPLRIALVSDFYLDYVGGAQSSIRQQKSALEQQGHTVALISLTRADRETLPGLRLDLNPAYTVPGVDLPIIGASRKTIGRISDFLRQNAIDVVHLQTEFGLAHATTTAAHALGIPVVHTVHTFYWQSRGIGPLLAFPAMSVGLQYVTRTLFPRRRYTRRPTDNLLRNLTAAMALRADAVISPSAHQASDLRTAGVTAPVAVVPNPVAGSSRAANLLTEELAGRPRVLWVARCEPEKRPLPFARAVIEALERTGGAFDVDFVGDGTELTALRRLTADHPQIRVHGGLDHAAVLDLMDSSSLVALTSHGFDNQPMTIAEATTRYRGVLYCDPNLLEGLDQSGHLTASPDENAIANALVELVTSPDRLIALSRGARHDSAVFSGATYVERVLRVYAEASAARTHLASE